MDNKFLSTNINISHKLILILMSNFLISMFDQFSYKPYIFVNGSERYVSIIPAIIGFLTYMASISIAVFFLIDALNKNVALISMNVNPNLYPFINISHTPVQIFLTDGIKTYNNDESIFSLTASYFKYSFVVLANSSDTVFSYNQIILEKCRESDLRKFGKNRIENTICINPEANNLTISGVYGDAYGGFSYLNIYLNQCLNSTNSKVVCKPKNIIDDYLKNVFVSFSMKMNYIDHQNSTNPFVDDFKMITFPMSSTIFKRYFLRLQKVIYMTDLGLIFEDKILQNDYIFGSQEANVDLKMGAMLNPGAIGQISLIAEPSTLEYRRSYTKLQTVIANAGGALKFLQTFTLLLCYVSTKRLYFEQLINYNFVERTEITKVKQNDSNFPIKRTNIFIFKKKEFEIITNENKNNLFKLKNHEKICPLLLWNKKRKTFYQTSENVIKKELSYANIINKLVQFENLKKAVLNDMQLQILENLPKSYPVLEEFYPKEMKLESIDFEDPIVKNLLLNISKSYI
jgi:hypothetical protein